MNEGFEWRSIFVCDELVKYFFEEIKNDQKKGEMTKNAKQT